MKMLTGCTLALLAPIALASALDEPAPLQALRDDAQKLRSVFESAQAQRMLDEVAHLPVCDERTIHVAVRPNRGYTQARYDALSDDMREGLQAFTVNAQRYYSTFYGSPLVYARTLDLLGQHAPRFDLSSARVMDLGYGQLGQLRLWAQMGAEVTGVEVDPILEAMYDGCGALGDIDGAGSLRLINGAWPNDPHCRKEVGSGYDLIVSRNLLKRGYVKPAQLNPEFPIPVAWGMSDQEALSHFYNALAPGGIIVIESLGPKPDPAKPWGDIANPWERTAWEAAGFEVLAHDSDESKYARTMGRAMGWEAQMDLEHDLFAVYSVYRKPAGASD